MKLLILLLRARFLFVERHDRARRLDAVHHRHLEVHEDEVERLAGVERVRVRPHRLTPVADHHGVEPHRLQNLLAHLLVHEVILGHEDADARLGVGVEGEQAELRLRLRRGEVHEGSATAK